MNPNQQPAQPNQPVQPQVGAAQTAAPQVQNQPQVQTQAQAKVGGAPTAPTPAPKTKQTSTQNALQIAEIRDGIVIMQDGSYRAILACQSINFDLMSPEEREAVEFSYQGFLNSLYFPIQVFVRSQKVDLRPYIEKLDKIRAEHDNMLLSLLMEDYIQYMSAVAAQTNIMDKKFYLIIPFFKEVDAQKAVEASKGFFSSIFGKKSEKVVINEADLENAKTELKNRIQAAMAGLQQCGVNSVPLDTQELIELYYDAYNPDTATRQQINNFKNLESPVVTKGEGDAYQPQLEREMDI